MHRAKFLSPEALGGKIVASSTPPRERATPTRVPSVIGLPARLFKTEFENTSGQKQTIETVTRMESPNKDRRRARSPAIASPAVMIRTPDKGSMASIEGRVRCETEMSSTTLTNWQYGEQSDTEDETTDDSCDDNATACATLVDLGLIGTAEEKFSPPPGRRNRVQSFDPSSSFAVTDCGAWSEENLLLSASCGTTFKSFRTASLGPAMTERLRRNTDSVTEDAAVAPKIKRRLEGRFQENRMVLANTALSDFITKTLTGEQTLDAEAAAQPTSVQVLKAADMARKSIVEGYFANLKDPELEERVQHAFLVSLRREEYHLRDTVCRQGGAGDTLFIIEEGTVQFTIGNQLAGSASSGSVFGDTSLVFGIPSVATATVTSPTVIAWTLDELAFRRIQGMMATATIDSISSTNHHKEASRLLDKQEGGKSPKRPANTIEFKDLTKGALLGEGSFGTVYMVTHKSKRGPLQKTYALKSLSKQSVIENRNQQRIILERNALQELSGSPFTIELVGTYQDADNIYFLSDLVQGGTFFSYMIRKDILTREETVFMSACLASALVHVHKKGFVHRDLKPENCLVGADGYLKLCDFGMAKRLPSTVLLPSGATGVVSKAFTICGTPEFTAPEMLLGVGYDRNVDWWAFACLIVEMIDGMSPFCFEGQIDSLKKNLQAVAVIGMGRREYTLPKSMSDDATWESAASLVTALLVPSDRRLGRDNFNEILEHSFFDSIDFELLQQKAIAPPDLPGVDDESDESHYSEEIEMATMKVKVPSYKGSNGWCQDF
jgi:serine/threonine protein kinase